MSYSITALHVYPIKSLNSIVLQEALLTDRGIEHDRRWMLVFENGTFITQRDFSELVFFNQEFHPDGIVISHPDERQEMIVPFDSSKYTAQTIQTEVWGQACIGQVVSEKINHWFSNILGHSVKLIYHPNHGKRSVNKHEDTLIAFPDSNQYLILGENALAHLNTKLDAPLPMNRFRPNIVFSGGQPHIEDTWQEVMIGKTQFIVVKSCARCQIIQIDQKSAQSGPEPMQTLTSYRRVDNKILFGRYLKLTSNLPAMIKVGDILIP